MKNSEDQGGCYPQRPKAEVDNTLRALQNSSYPTKAEFNNCFIIHSKYFPVLREFRLFRSLNITQPCPQVFSVNDSIICSVLQVSRHFDVIGSIICSGTREKRSAHACLPCFWREFASASHNEFIRDCTKTNYIPAAKFKKASSTHRKISLEFHEHKFINCFSFSLLHHIFSSLHQRRKSSLKVHAVPRRSHCCCFGRTTKTTNA